MTSEAGPLLDEHTLRRALRLDADEVPARLDPALIAAAAAPRRNDRLVTAVAVAFIGGWAWSELVRALLGGFVAATGIDPLAVAIGLVTDALVRVAPLAQAATSPVTPIAILAAAVVAVLSERQGRARAAAPVRAQ